MYILCAVFYSFLLTFVYMIFYALAFSSEREDGIVITSAESAEYLVRCAAMRKRSGAINVINADANPETNLILEKLQKIYPQLVITNKIDFF